MRERLDQRERQGNLRKLEAAEGLVDLASNDYLGLARSPAFFEMTLQECQKNPWVGSTGSRLLTGHSIYVEQLEAEMAQFHRFEKALLFQTGYLTNLGLLSTIPQEGDFIFYDAQIHASTRAGISLSKATAIPFRHNDLEHLEARLKSAPENCVFYICVESIYSTDGTMAPLTEIVRLGERYRCRLIVDEAHALGIRGPQGRGVLSELNLEPYVFAAVATMGKALGCQGGAVLGSALLIDALINFSAPFIYTTALAFPLLAMVRSSYRLFPKMDEERRRIKELVAYFGTSQTQIQTISIPGAAAAKAMARRCREAGLDVRALTSPTVRQGSERLRICLHAYNTEEELALLKQVVQ